MDILDQTFSDGCKIKCDESADSDDCIDIPGEWDILLNDDALLDQAVDNLSTSLFDVSIANSDNSSYTVSIPNAAACAIEHMTISPVKDQFFNW